jgi:hypothetical protein
MASCSQMANAPMFSIWAEIICKQRLIAKTDYYRVVITVVMVA